MNNGKLKRETRHCTVFRTIIKAFSRIVNWESSVEYVFEVRSRPVQEKASERLRKIKMLYHLKHGILRAGESEDESQLMKFGE